MAGGVSLTSSRLILRQTSVREASEAARFFLANKKFHDRPERKPSYYTAAFWRRQIAQERLNYRKDRGIVLYLFLKTNPKEMVGEVVFDGIYRGYFQSCFLGYLLGQQYEGKGLMTEALRTAIPFVFSKMHLHRISAAHVPKNKKSCRVLKKLGFRVVGLEKDYLRLNGKWIDHELHVLINKKWRP